MTEIICSRWGKKTNFSDVENTDLKRIIRVKPLPKKYLVKRDWIAIATDGTSVRYKDTSYPINNFFSEEMFPYPIRILVLTEKERQLLLRNVTELEYLKNIDVFEYLYPIFTDIRYSKNIIKSHKNLISYLRRAKRFSPEGIPLAKYVSFQNHKKLLKKVAFKNGYDKYFALTDRTAYQEVFTLTEERPNRTVIALDYNAMFPDCLSGDEVPPSLEPLFG